MHLDRNIAARPALADLPRARGSLALTSKHARGKTIAANFRTSGCLKALFARHPSRCEAIVINTSGGLTGGDGLSLTAVAGSGSHLTLTTQAAERAYRAAEGEATVTSRISVEPGATLHWLPQELIFFNGAALSRSLTVDLAKDARALIVEPVVFGRPAMGETVCEGNFADQISITKNGAPLYRDGLRLTGNIARTMARPAVGNGAGAMAAVICICPEAESHLGALQSSLPPTAGASLIAPDTLVARFLAEDAFALRRSLLPVLDRLSGGTLPTSWRL